MIIGNLVGTALWTVVAGWLVMSHHTPIRLLVFALAVIAFIIALYVWLMIHPGWQEEENV